MPIKPCRFQLFTIFGMILFGVFLLHCKAHMMDAPYPKTSDTIEPGSLSGPFSGQIKDTNGQPVSNAWVVAEWIYSDLTQLKSQPQYHTYILTLQTGKDGKYRIPMYTPPSCCQTTKFQLKVYVFGYTGYRSDLAFEENTARKDFSQEDNIIFLTPFPKGISHQKHLVFLGCDESLTKCQDPLSKIAEQELALAVTEKTHPALLPDEPLDKELHPIEPPLPIEPPIAPTPVKIPAFMNAKVILLDALKHLPQKKYALPLSNLDESFDAIDFADEINHFVAGPTYAGIHLKAKQNKQNKRDETQDVAIRIWHPTESGSATKMFDELKGKLHIKKSTDKEANPMIQIYDSQLKIHGAILLLRKPGVVVQLSCGAHLCTNKKLAMTLLFAIQDQINSLYE